jgi:hypothetical protein
MYRYTGFSLIIESEVELSGSPAGRGAPDVIIRRGRIARRQGPATPDDEVAFARKIGRFHIMLGREITVDLLPGADAEGVRTLLAGRVMAYLLRQRGYLPLHASAVAIDGKAILFLGASGSGKSTTAAAFHARGHEVMADDVAAVRMANAGVELEPEWPHLRLLEDSGRVIGTAGAAAQAGLQNGKCVYHLDDRLSDVSCMVKRIYALDYAGSPAVSFPLSGFSSVALLNANSFISKRRTGQPLRQMNLDRAGAVAAASPVRRLVRPRSLDLLPDLVSFVEREVMSYD